MSNLALRFITGIIGVAVIVFCLLFGEHSTVFLLFFISVMSLLEFYKLCESGGYQPQKGMGHIINTLVFISLLFYNLKFPPYNLAALVILLPFVVFIRELFTASEKPFTNIAYTLLGNVYITFPLLIFYLIDAGNNNNYLLAIFILIWSNDTGAYFAGKYLGKRKLFERISPKKTWEGFAGGAILAVGISILLAETLVKGSPVNWPVIAVIVVIFGTLGDLIESMLKRSIQIKDSGNILPGHGGFLDRFDALFIVAPFIFFYLSLLSQQF